MGVGVLLLIIGAEGGNFDEDADAEGGNAEEDDEIEVEGVRVELVEPEGEEDFALEFDRVEVKLKAVLETDGDCDTEGVSERVSRIDAVAEAAGDCVDVVIEGVELRDAEAAELRDVAGVLDPISVTVLAVRLIVGDAEANVVIVTEVDEVTDVVAKTICRQ